MEARIIAYYLPQFHPIPENDKYWGPGYTEWTSVAQARPMFKGHYQPHIPADLGFYDLRLPEVREKQAGLAREAGIEGFCYYHYWLGNGKDCLNVLSRRLLRRVSQISHFVYVGLTMIGRRKLGSVEAVDSILKK